MNRKIVSNLKDIAESEARLRLVAEVANLCAWEHDLVQNNLKWGKNAENVIGCSSGDLPTDPQQLFFYAASQARTLVTESYFRAIAEKQETFTLDFLGKPGDESRKYWQVRAKILTDAKSGNTRVVAACQNVTSQKAAEKDLRLLAERLATAEEAAGALIYDWDVANDFILRSSGLLRFLGWEPEEVGTKMQDWLNLRHPDDLPSDFHSPFHHGFEANDKYVVEYRVRHKAGHYIWVQDSGRVFRDRDEKIIRAAGATVDITSRKRFEASINRQANLINLSFEPILVWHPVRGIVEWNDGAEQLYGYTRSEAIGKSSHILLQTQSSIPASTKLEQLRLTGSWSGELEHRAKDGRRIFVDSRQQTIDSDGEILILETNRDIGERKRADQYIARMGAVALASHDALFGISLEGYIETWNPAAERVFGYAAKEAIGQHVNILAEPNKFKEQTDLMILAQSSPTVAPYEARRVRKDGIVIHVSIALAPVKREDGTVDGISVSIYDLTEQREWQSRQRMMNRELAHRNKNSFAVLQSIMRSTLRTAKNPAEFAESFSNRLHSLATAQDILTAYDWRGVELGALARLQLAGYVAVEDSRIDITGPEVMMPAEMSTPFALIFNELATNAVKYGALSLPTGNVQLYWTTQRPERDIMNVNITWRERGGPAIAAPKKRGFGSTLIEKSLPDAKVTQEYDVEGLTCKIFVSIKTAQA